MNALMFGFELIGLVVKSYPKIIVIKNFAGIQQTVSIDRVKPALIKEDAAVNSPSSTPDSTPPLLIYEDVIVEDSGEEEEIMEDISMPNTVPKKIETRLGRKIAFRNHDYYLFYYIVEVLKRSILGGALTTTIVVVTLILLYLF